MIIATLIEIKRNLVYNWVALKIMNQLLSEESLFLLKLSLDPCFSCITVISMYEPII